MSNAQDFCGTFRHDSEFEACVDLVIIDMIMEPDFDGLTTYQTIRQVRASQRVILATGYAATDRVVEAQRRGAGACLSKPFTPIELRRAVRAGLDQAPATA